MEVWLAKVLYLPTLPVPQVPIEGVRRNAHLSRVGRWSTLSVLQKRLIGT